MGQTTNQIEAHIENTREDLGSNLQELEQKVKSVVDWKQHYQANPMAVLGIALGGGVLLATMLGGRRNGRTKHSVASIATGAESHAGKNPQVHKALETWENIKNALVGVAAARFTDYVGEIVPGFHEHFQRAEEKAKRISAAGQAY